MCAAILDQRKLASMISSRKSQLDYSEEMEKGEVKSEPSTSGSNGISEGAPQRLRESTDHQDRHTVFVLENELPVLDFSTLAKTNIFNLQCQLRKMHDDALQRLGGRTYQERPDQPPVDVLPLDPKSLEDTLHKYGKFTS